MLTLEEIENISFRRSGLSGYKTEDVDSFVDGVIEKVRDLELANKELELRIDQLNTRILKHEENAESVQDAIITAEITSKRLVREATEKAEKTVSEADAKAEATLRDAEERSAAMLSEAEIRSETILNSALARSAASIDANNRIIEQQKQHIIQIQSEVTRFREALIDSYKSHLKIINSLPRAEEFKQYQEKLDESYPLSEPATPESVGQELQEEADRAVEAARKENRGIRVEKVDEDKIREISDDIRRSTKGQEALKEDERKAKIAAEETEKAVSSEEALEMDEPANDDGLIELNSAEVMMEQEPDNGTDEPDTDDPDEPEDDADDTDESETDNNDTNEPETDRKDSEPEIKEVIADNEPEVQSEASKPAADSATREFIPLRKRGKKKKGKHRQAPVSHDKSEDSNAKDIEAAFTPGKTTEFKDEPKPTSIDDLEDGVIFNTGKDAGTSQIKREPIRLHDDPKGKKFDFSDIE